VSTSSTSSDPWQRSVAELTAFSKILGMKLADTTAVNNAGKVVVEFGLEIEYEWVNDKPKAKAAIHDVVKKHFGAEVVLEFTVRRRESSQDEHSAVELPAEGSKLEALARQVFGADPKGTQDEIA